MDHMSTILGLGEHILEVVLFFSKAPTVSLVCHSMRNLMDMVCRSIVGKGNIRFISELSNRRLVIELIQQFSQEILLWCLNSALNVVHLIHPKIKLDKELCEITLCLTKGLSYELLPIEMRNDVAITMIALNTSKGLVYKFLSDELQTIPEVCQLCFGLLNIEPFDIDRSTSHQAMLIISNELEMHHLLKCNVVTEYNYLDELYHRRITTINELRLVRSFASTDVNWRFSYTFDTHT